MKFAIHGSKRILITNGKCIEGPGYVGCDGYVVGTFKNKNHEVQPQCEKPVELLASRLEGTTGMSVSLNFFLNMRYEFTWKKLPLIDAPKSSFQFLVGM